MASQSPEWNPRQQRQRPVSTLALNFSAALDELFKLGATEELAQNVEQKKTEVKQHERQLEDLDQQLRQAEERLKRLQTKHKRMQSEYIPYTNRNRDSRKNESDSDEQTFSDGHSSPTSDDSRR